MTQRQRILGFIGCWLLVQALVPLLYYVAREDKHDERFAWRMFSPTRMLTCNPDFEVGGQHVPLASTFHESWIEIAKRGRFVVLEAMGQRLCKLNPGKKVTLDLQCTSVDGKKESWGGSDLCLFPEL